MLPWYCCSSLLHGVALATLREDFNMENVVVGGPSNTKSQRTRFKWPTWALLVSWRMVYSLKLVKQLKQAPISDTTVQQPRPHERHKSQSRLETILKTCSVELAYSLPEYRVFTIPASLAQLHSQSKDLPDTEDPRGIQLFVAHRPNRLTCAAVFDVNHIW